jgi:hypothetical protein
LNNFTAGVREREEANRTREAGHLDEIQSVAATTLELLLNGAVGFIERLCDKSELIDSAKMTTLTIDRYEVFRCLGMVERRRLSSIFSRCSDFSHSLSIG